MLSTPQTKSRRISFWDGAAAGQRLIIGGIVAAAALAKMTSPHSATAQERTALGRLITEPWARRTVWSSMTAFEAMLALGLLGPWRSRAPAAAAAAFFLVGSAYTMWARRYAPGLPCGCFGAAGSDSISDRDIGRNLAMLAASLVATSRSSAWTVALRNAPALLFLIAEAAVVARSFPELARVVRHISRRPKSRACAVGAELTQDQARSRLMESRAWSELRLHLADDPVLEAWREGCFWFYAASARYLERNATAIFGVHVDPIAGFVHGAITDGSDRVLTHVGQAPLPEPPIEAVAP